MMIELITLLHCFKYLKFKINMFELDAIFLSVFINQATWNLITHAHLYTRNMEAEKEKVLVALHSQGRTWKKIDGRAPEVGVFSSLLIIILLILILIRSKTT